LAKWPRRPKLKDSVRIRLLTYNIHKCIGGLDRRYDPERIAVTVAHHAPDLVLLQEVDDRAARSLHHRQVDLLGEALGLRHRSYFANVRLRRGGEYGNAVLSRHPITDARNIDLTIPPKKRRGALHVRLRVRHGALVRTVHVFNLHLGLSGIERRLQLRRFFAGHPFAYLDQRAPIVVAGDLNDVWGTLGRVAFQPAGFRGVERAVPTFPAYAPVRALDAIYVRGSVEIAHLHRSHLALARRASDHLPLVADLELR
jgi:endonuclease/exonuclease/phosphatase family metal-dependent hydrolase